jgi:decaprenyl-phosphate phosphoribosyltransferase
VSATPSPVAKTAEATIRAAPPRPSLGGALRLLRVKQWIKNAFVIAPLLFSGSFSRVSAVRDALLATMLFCFASSATYILNDIADVNADAAHPVKSKTRPLASGAASIRAAWSLEVVLLAVVFGALAWQWETALVAIGYLALNVAYSFKLKHVPVLDIFALASGFVFRVFAGAVAIDVPLSSWMLITTLSISLYLASIKRREELNTSGSASRSVLRYYTPRLLDRYAETAAIASIVFYGLFVVTIRPRLNVSMPFVLFGLFRYWYIVEQKGHGESPTDVVWTDPPLIITVILWAAVCAWRLRSGGG